ncbi:acetyltransferase [Cohnella luojiensis]|uniref:Acetyltransferase n=1 Tax=Cohnella luojiensis TaxID=652876 RepID=A0A4Y8M2K4_9BACL|nr:acetyltransferase [Cohnella luojiensis]TFE29041.1 acetyltransferase [Cohnella luojiensis]
MVDSKPIILLGGGGHALVCLDLLIRCKRQIIGYVALTPTEQMEKPLIPFLGNELIADAYPPQDFELVNGVGGAVGSSRRQHLFEEMKRQGYSFATLIHDHAIVADSAILAEGVQVMAGAVIQAGALIGANSVINTRASVDHESWIGAHTHVAPGTTLCGGVHVGNGVLIGAGSTVIQSISIGERSVVGAGSVVVRNVPADTLVVGVPAKERTR